jgi:hypothetical protein
LNRVGDLNVVVWILEVGRNTLEELGPVHLGACMPDYLDISREESVPVETEKRRESLNRLAGHQATGRQWTFFFARSPDAPKTTALVSCARCDDRSLTDNDCVFLEFHGGEEERECVL